MSDRAVQDEVIRYLADASVRQLPSHAAPISVEGEEKAERFARFLARRYYRDRLARSFRYSHRFHHEIGRTAEEIVDGADFSEFLDQCVMGSLESAHCVGEMARKYLLAARRAGWWPELLDYEFFYFLQAATTERAASIDRPLQSVSAVCRRFAWSLPEMLPRLRAQEPIGDDLQRGVTLLFSRTHAGQIYVVELEPAMEAVFRCADGQRSAREVIAEAGVSAEQARSMLAALADIGAIQPAVLPS